MERGWTKSSTKGVTATVQGLVMCDGERRAGYVRYREVRVP